MSSRLGLRTIVAIKEFFNQRAVRQIRHHAGDCYGLWHNLVAEVEARSEVNIGEVIAKDQVRRDLASAYRLHPPLCAVPRFRMRCWSCAP
jgi:hypothetical protein